MTNEQFIESIKLEGEEWRPVVGWEGRYMVSSFGRAAALYNPSIRSDGRHNNSKQRLLKGEINHSPNSHVVHVILNLKKDGKRFHMSMHRLVAMAFIPNPNNYPCIDHIDTNGLNNHVENLRWCTQKMNVNNPITKARYLQSMSKYKGVPNTKCSFKVVQLDMHGNYIKTYPSLSSCSIDGFSRWGVTEACQGKRSKYKDYKWLFASDYELLINKSKNPNGSEKQLSLPFKD